MNGILALLAMLSLAGAAAVPKERRLCFCAGGGDEDMKIANDALPAFDCRRESDEAAGRFIRHRENGNIQRAKELGEAFAHQMKALESASGDPAVLAQKKVLFAFVVNKVIEETAPDSILAQAALSSFYQTVQEIAPGDYATISDSAAFSLYILADRGRRNRNQDTPGEVFAELCGQRGREEYCYIGQSLYNQYHLDCLDLCRQTEFFP